jgi:transcriptional regulator with XRE-family HTH domain
VIPLISALAEARREAGLHQQHIATGLGLGAAAGVTMVSAWERGRSAPKVGHACGYASLVSRRIVAVRDGQVVGNLADLMPHLRELLAEAGLTIQDVATGLFVARTSISSIIRKAGPQTQLTSVMSVLGAARCTLDLAPAAEPAAGHEGVFVGGEAKV